MGNLTLGEKIRNVRKGLKLNQLDFARKLGLESATAISKYEDNSRTPDKNKLVIIAKLGNITLDELLTGDEPSGKYEEIEGHKSLTVAEKLGDYQQKTEQPDINQMDKIKISEDLILATRVLESNTAYATALHLNIRSFARAIDAEERIALLETNQREFEEKVTSEIAELRKEVKRLRATYEGNDGGDGQLLNTNSNK